MNLKINQPLGVFIFSLFLIALPLFLFPINLFPGEIILTFNGAEQIIKAPMSLSYFIGLGYESSDMADVKDFYLTSGGYALAVCLLLGLPLIISYRVYLKQKRS